MNHVKYVIIGSGVSGLSFAVQKRTEDYLILERDSIPGGLAKSFYDSGFVWDVAGHFFHFHSEETKRYYENLLGGKEQVLATKCAKVFYDGHYMDAPFQYNISQLPKEQFIECLVDLYFANYSNENVQFDEFVKAKYGAGIANKFLIPYNEKLYACKMNELEKDSMGAFLPKLDFSMLMDFYRGMKGRTYNDTFLYPKNGCNEVVSSLVEALDVNRIHYNEAVVKVDIQQKTVYTEAGAYKYDYLINTAPLNNFVEMCDLDAYGLLNYNQVLVLNIGFDLPSIDKKVSWAYFPGDECFYRVGFYNNITGTERLSVYVEIGYKSNESIDIDSALNRTLNDLKRVNVIDTHRIVSYNSVIITPGYVYMTNKGKVYVSNIIQQLENNDIHMIGRYARWEYSAMDNSIEQAINLARVI